MDISAWFMTFFFFFPFKDSSEEDPLRAVLSPTICFIPLEFLTQQNTEP